MLLLPFVRLLVCSFVNSITQKLIDGISSNFHTLVINTKVRADSILEMQMSLWSSLRPPLNFMGPLPGRRSAIYECNSFVEFGAFYMRDTFDSIYIM